MTTQLAPLPIFKAFDNVGLPLAFGKLYTYQAGTTTPQATYTDSTGNTQNPNPITLNARGETPLWLNPTLNYKFALTDALGNQIPGWPVDNINGSLYPGNSIIPNTSNAFTLGSAQFSWANGYFGPNCVPVFDAGSGAIGYWPRTAAEIAAGVTPVNYAYVPGDVRRYGAIGGGVIDDSAAFANAALVCGTYPMSIPYISGGYKIVTPFALPANATAIGLDRPLLFATVNGTPVCTATAGGPITLTGIRFQGSSASTLPLSGFGGFSAQSTGLVTIANCSNIRVTDCEFSTFYNGLSANGCTRAWVQRNVVSTYLYTGILTGETTQFEIECNDISNCTQAGASVAYGVQCTGNQAGSQPAQYNSVSFNRIRDIPSWDAIGSHDIDGLRVIGNDIRNVRHGIDIGFLVNTNVVENITVANNYVEGTAVDTWSSASAEIGGIIVAGFDATHRVLGATITGNMIRGFFNVNGMVGAGNGAGCISVSNIDDANITGNIITGGGTGNTPQSTGIYCAGVCNRLTIASNSIEGGSYPRGGIRLENVVADIVMITGNSGIQSTTGNDHLAITGSTITGLSVGNNPSNSTSPYVEGTSTITYIAGNATGQSSLTLTGCTTAPAANATWSVSNGVVTLNIPSITATSNATTCALTGLPAELQPAAQTCVCVMPQFEDNGAFAAGVTATIAPGSGTITFGKGGSPSGFTATGTKGPNNSTITYMIN